MGGGHIDDVQVRRAYQLLRCTVTALQSTFVGEGRGPLRLTGCDRDHALAGVLLQQAHESVGDPPSPDHTPTHARSQSRVGYSGLRKPVRECHSFSWFAAHGTDRPTFWPCLVTLRTSYKWCVL